MSGLRGGTGNAGGERGCGGGGGMQLPNGREMKMPIMYSTHELSRWMSTPHAAPLMGVSFVMVVPALPR